MRERTQRAFAQAGATLLELMISVSIIAILLGLVAPNASLIVSKSKVTAQINFMSSLLRYTRHNAIDNYVSTSLCPSANLIDCDFSNWNLPKMLFADTNFNNKRDPDEVLIHATPKTSKGVIMQGPRRALRFYENGTLGSPATIIVCPDAPQPKLVRALFVSLQGRVRLSEDTNNDEIHERGNGQVLACD